ncbi:MAG: Gfo/Idh/MocA family oxidoreductase [Bacillota bacterium]
MLSQPDLEGVSICTPDALHRGPVLTAARRKKQVLVEKPMASTLGDAEGIADAVRYYSVRGTTPSIAFLKDGPYGIPVPRG